MVSKNRISPQPLLQELLWPNRWKCTVACLLLNVTTRTQVDKVWPALFNEAPDPESLLSMDIERLKEIIAPLGLRNRRAERLRQMSAAFGKLPHEKLPGVGLYAYQSDRIFFHDDLLRETVVKDGALTKYLDWRKKQTWKKLS